MNLDGNSVVSKSDNFVETKADGEVILMHLDEGSFFSLGSTGKRIWELLDGSQSVSKLCQKLAAEFDVSQDQCLADTIELLGQLKEQNLINVAATPGS